MISYCINLSNPLKQSTTPVRKIREYKDVTLITRPSKIRSSKDSVLLGTTSVASKMSSGSSKDKNIKYYIFYNYTFQGAWLDT